MQVTEMTPQTTLSNQGSGGFVASILRGYLANDINYYELVDALQSLRSQVKTLQPGFKKTVIGCLLGGLYYESAARTVLCLLAESAAEERSSIIVELAKEQLLSKLCQATREFCGFELDDLLFEEANFFDLSAEAQALLLDFARGDRWVQSGFADYRFRMHPSKANQLLARLADVDPEKCKRVAVHLGPKWPWDKKLWRARLSA